MTALAVLIADISGSTPLYELHGTDHAMTEVGQCLHALQDVIRNTGGEYVNSKGDDVLSLFSNPEAAFFTARAMFDGAGSSVLSLHAGLYWGEITRLDGNVYGTPVYTAARLAALAKPGELLVGDSCVPMLGPASLALLRPVGAVQLKGRAAATEVMSYVASDTQQLTEVETVPAGQRVDRAESARIAFDGRERRIGEGEALVLGRAGECDLVIPLAWVSRRHATISLTRGLVEFTDHSSTGSYLTGADGRQVEIRRRTIALSGAGTISLGAPGTGATHASVGYEVDHRAARTGDPSCAGSIRQDS